MREPLRSALADLSAIVAAEPPDLAELRGVVRLVVSDVPATALGAALAAELMKRAPGVDLIFHPWHVGDEVERLERGEIDLVISVAATTAASLRTTPLVTYPYVVLMRKEHPAAKAEPLDLDTWLAYPHVVVSGRGHRQGSADAAVGRVGRKRRVGLVAPNFLHALELLGETDMLATFPAGVMVCAAATRLTSRPPPIHLDPVTLHLLQHKRSQADPAVSLVADLVRAIAPGLPGQEVLHRQGHATSHMIGLN